jgi:FAD synthase
MAHGQVVVTMQALERTAVGDFDGNFRGHTTALEALVKERREITICSGLNQVQPSRKIN